MTTERCMTQTELAERWRISEATLERWRTALMATQIPPSMATSNSPT